MFKKILLALAILLLLIQFIRPSPNVSDSDAIETHDISTKYPMSGEVKQLLSVACKDCHSNNTRYPWYAKMQPLAWWLNHHVEEGKHELNFSEFTKRPIAVQNHKFEEIIETVESHEMPLESYTTLGLHQDAKLSDSQRTTIINWAKTQMDSLKAQYPADSLILKRKKPTQEAKVGTVFDSIL